MHVVKNKNKAVQSLIKTETGKTKYQRNYNILTADELNLYFSKIKKVGKNQTTH